MSATPDAPILLVEDNPDDEALTLRAFKRSNVVNDVEVVRDGQEALDYLFGNGEPAKRAPAMILLDLKLPKVDGLEVLKQVRAHPLTKLIPVIILTSSHEEVDLLNTHQHHALDAAPSTASPAGRGLARRHGVDRPRPADRGLCGRAHPRRQRAGPAQRAASRRVRHRDHRSPAAGL